MSHHHETPTDSNSIRQGRNSDDETLVGDSSGVVLNFPSRQPRSPPGRRSRQKQEGFKRFLKQVASPPHHRVTAGGRIVPFAPQTPPPIMNFCSIDNAILQSAMSEQFRDKTTDVEAFKDCVERIVVPQSRSSVSSNLDTTLSSTSNQRQAIAKCDNNDAWYAFWDEQKVFSQRMALSSPPPAGEVLVPFNGIWYRVFWIGDTMINEPLQFNPSLGLQTVAYPTSYGRRPIIPQHNSMTPPIMVSSSQMSFSNVPNSSSVSLLQHQGTQFGVQALTRSYNILNAQLEKLDKHLSLKFNKLTPRETFALTEERKNLIIHTNFLRVSIVKLTCGSNVNSNFQTFRSSGDPQCLAFDTASRPPTAPLDPDQDIKQKSIKDGNGVTSSYLSKPSMGQQSFLSPNAPAFVPSNKKATLSIPNGHEKQEEAGQNQVGQMPIFNGDDTASQDSVNSGIKNATEQLLNDDVDEIETPAELLPVITQKQIEYAQTLNSPNGEKVYCSTVEDVAEVIRRVREQATMYGCEGGQSKDPAYDAEQDIHWEIHEKAPILLPGPISDHVANPRPWDWKSSAYNPKAEANKKPPASRMHSLSFKSATSRNSAPPPSKSAGGNHNKTILPSILEEESNHEERLFDRISHRRTGSLYSEGGLDDEPMNSKDEIYGLDAVEMAGALSAGVNLDITIPNFQELVAKTSAAILDGSFDLAQYTKSRTTSTLRKSEVEDKKSVTIATDNTEKEIRRPYQAYVEDDNTDSTSPNYHSVRTSSTAAPISSHASVASGAQPSSNGSIVENASPNGVNYPGAQPIPIPVRSTSKFDPLTVASPRGLSLLSVPVDDPNDPRMWEAAVNPVWDWGTGDLIGLGEYSPGPEVFGPSDGNFTIDYLDDSMANSETQNTVGSNGINARVGR